MLGMFNAVMDDAMLRDIETSHKMREDMRHDVSSAMRQIRNLKSASE